jgi:putative CocE/NonD family hydrolase
MTTHENIFVPLTDGTRLAARLWHPENATDQPVPAVVEYMPYRKRDQTRPRDEPIHAWLSQRGYACLRVDMRGSGDSDGLLLQEFQQQEQDDAVEMIAWLAAQPWCDGSVAMLGKSWGGFAALQVALRQPTALKAIIVVCAGDDRYDQSLHYTGGALLNEQLWWNNTMMLFNMRPPDPAISGPTWAATWRTRLEAVEPWIGEWLKHQRRDEFWQQGSVSDDPAGLRCALFAVGGWADYISRSVPRLLASVQAPRWGLVGPWGHHYPHDGVPGPAIGFLQECERFLDTTLKGGTSYTNEPQFRAWIADWHAPGPTHVEQTGHWVPEQQWPSPHIRPWTLYLTATGLATKPPQAATFTHRSEQTVGLCSPEWLSQAVPGEAPLDQSEDDGKSLTFDTEPLTERVEILGSAILEAEIAVDQPLALLAARLNDIAPDGTSLRVALGVLNLTHRDGHHAPQPLQPGRRYKIRLELAETGHAFAPGHRIRLALSTTFWPIIWPSPAPVTLTLHTGTSRLILPERPPDPADATLRPFEPPEAGPPVPITILEPARISRHLTRDLLTGNHVLSVKGDGGFLGPGRRYRLDPTGTILGHRIRKRYEINENDPLSAQIEIAEEMELERDDWCVRLTATTRFRSTATDFLIEAEIRAYQGADLIHDRAWQLTQPRELA